MKKMNINKQLLEDTIMESNKDFKIIRRVESARFSLTGECEMAYFSSIRNFLKTSVAHNIMDRNQDNYELKLKCKL
jgi:hypothetical protein